MTQRLGTKVHGLNCLDITEGRNRRDWTLRIRGQSTWRMEPENDHMSAAVAIHPMPNMICAG